MSLYQLASCAYCNGTLPRAAAFRCPHCREPFASGHAGLRHFCRRCGTTLAQGFAGECPACIPIPALKGQGVEVHI